MANKNQAMATAKYDKLNTKHLVMKLNINTDADVLERLDSVKSKQGYIKELIRNDIKKPIIK